MKRSKFTSFLLTIAFGLFAFNFSSAQTSADCQARVNMSLGAGCNLAIPYEAFNTWEPSCMLIIDEAGHTVAAITGSGTVTKVDCYFPVDSIWFDTVFQSKINVYKFDAWLRQCDGPSGGETIYADIGGHTFCNPLDTAWTPAHGFIVPGPIPAGVDLVLASAPACDLHADSALVTDGKLFIRDSVVTYSIKRHVDIVMRSDTFSHTDPLRWVYGTAIVSAGGETFSVHDLELPEEPKVTMVCGLPDLADLLGDDFKMGPARLAPGHYTYNNYTQDGLNFCWGELWVEYKLWPTTPGQFDYMSCVELTDYSRAHDYEYHPYTAQKLEEVCAWAEAAGVLRTDADVAAVVNASIAHCYTHTVTHKDKWDKNFDWLCDTAVKFRHFFVDHPGSNGDVTIVPLAWDTLEIRPILMDSVYFPDSIIAMKCGIIDEYDAKHIAEYLYHAYIHSGTTPVLTDYDTVDKYEETDPCDGFGNQYTGSPATYLSWSKIFQHADYNNYGVEKAFPYVRRHIKTVDGGLVAKGVPTADATLGYVKIPINKVVCNIAASKTDLHPVEICPGEKKIFRRWTLVDWCTGTIREQIQIIKILDLDKPYVTHLDGKFGYTGAPDHGYFLDADDDNSKGREDGYFGRLDLDDHSPYDDVGVNNGNFEHNVGPDHGGYIPVRWEKVTNPWGCTVRHTFPVPWLTDHCSTPQYEFELLDGGWNSSGSIYTAGDYVDIAWLHGEGLAYPIVKLYVWDECGNDDVYYYYLKALDKIPPVVVLHDQIIVTLTANNEDFVGTVEHGPTGTEGEGIAKIYCHNIDAGSHDGDCGPVTCQLRKQGDASYGDFVHFDCDDIGDVIVEVLITDYSGNYSSGWMTVTVENKNGPYIICEDVVIDCTDPIYPDWVGYPHVIGICAAPELTYEDEYNVDDLCFSGYIKRTWSVDRYRHSVYYR